MFATVSTGPRPVLKWRGGADDVVLLGRFYERYADHAAGRASPDVCRVSTVWFVASDRRTVAAPRHARQHCSVKAVVPRRASG
jgi:hypothetical protein